MLVDIDEGITVTESGAILIYLAEKTGKLLPTDRKGRVKAIEMVIAQVSGLGPMFGQLMVFRGAWQNKAPEVSDRYFKEVSRIYGVLNKRLKDKTYFAGEEFSIADIAMFTYIAAGTRLPFAQDLPLGDNPNLAAWLQRVAARPAVQKGLTIPEPFAQEKQFEGFIKSTVGLGDLHA